MEREWAMCSTASTETPQHTDVCMACLWKSLEKKEWGELGRSSRSLESTARTLGFTYRDIWRRRVFWTRTDLNMIVFLLYCKELAVEQGWKQREQSEASEVNQLCSFASGQGSINGKSGKCWESGQIFQDIISNICC